MKLTLAGRRSPMRPSAHAVPARYALVSGYDENAASIALIATLAACAVLVVFALPLHG